ncbi:uncharacterized protein LOC115059129 [Echeneis naucrates]|uniref:Uncharacterized LOC115059129 n=1 Tax=Echeneis naucrates TaxID=173247 RepID=A0A665T261_ECHNA|nr:uncharacterized protein LOC115059129 [Echeneis naucrates]
MIYTWEIFAFLSCTAMIKVLHCNADHLLPPTHLSYKWLDAFTVNVSWSWKSPPNLPEGCEIKYVTEKQQSRGVQSRHLGRTPSRFITDNCLTEEMSSDSCTYTISTTGHKLCQNWTHSTPVNITVYSKKPQVKLVEDFRCLPDSDRIHCSWIPVNQSLVLKLTYRMCGIGEEVRNGTKHCQNLHSRGNGCFIDTDGSDICILLDSEIGQSTFRAFIGEPSPKLEIKKAKHCLNLTWTPPEMGRNCWIYQFNYTKCGKPQPQQTAQTNFVSIPYDENCLYQFQSRVLTTKDCLPRQSDWSDVVNFGADVPPDGTPTVIAIVIPIILSACVLLSCYFFRKHRKIFCPTIPDPSAIFKGIMNGNKDHKPIVPGLYAPVDELVHTCNVDIPPENKENLQEF